MSEQLLLFEGEKFPLKDYLKRLRAEVKANLRAAKQKREKHTDNHARLCFEIEKHGDVEYFKGQLDFINDALTRLK